MLGKIFSYTKQTNIVLASIMEKFPKLLKIAVKHMRYFVNLGTNKNNSLELIDGSDAFLIKDLSKALGFKYELYTPADGEWGTRKSDGSWTGILGMLDRGEVDMSVAGISITEERSDSFSQMAYQVFEYTFVTNKPNFASMAGKFLTPFTVELWTACLAAYFLTTLIIWFCSREKCSLVETAMQTIAIVLQQDSAQRSSMDWAKLSWIVATRFLVFSYCAVLLSFLTMPVRDEGIRTFKELGKRVSGGHYIVLCSKGSVAVELLKHNSNLRNIAEKVVQNDWYVKKVNGSHPKEFGPDSAIVGPKLVFQLNYGVEPFTTKLISSETIAVVNIGLAVKKNFCCKKTLSHVVNRIVEAGLYDSYIQRMKMQSFYNLPKVEQASPTRPLSISDFQDVFNVLGVGWLVAIIVFFVECTLKSK